MASGNNISFTGDPTAIQFKLNSPAETVTVSIKDSAGNIVKTITETGFPVGGGSDGNFAASTGTPVLDGLGGVGDGAHAEHEYEYQICTVSNLFRFLVSFV